MSTRPSIYRMTETPKYRLHTPIVAYLDKGLSMPLTLGQLKLPKVDCYQTLIW